MGVLVDPKKKDLNLTLYFIEETKPHTNVSIFNFIKNEEDLAYWKSQGYRYEEEIIEAKKNATKDVIIDDSKKITKLRVKMQRTNWKEQNEIYTKSIKIIPFSDGTSRAEVDGIRYRDNKLKKTLLDWDLKDDAGNKIECTSDIIDQLVPEVADELIAQYDQLTNPISLKKRSE